MDNNYLTNAIKKLHPEAEFSYSDDNYETIKFDFIEGSAPTKAEIDAAIVEIKAEEIAAKAQAATDKTAALAKLEALGLTTDDLKALGL